MLWAQSDDDLVLNNLQYTITCDVFKYISGFIVRKIKQIINCNIYESELSENYSSSLIDIKFRGFLIKPSKDVLQISMKAEFVFKSNMNIIH